MSPEAFKEYGESAYQAGLVGGPLGAASKVVSRNQAQAKLAEQTPPAQPESAPPTAPVAPAGPSMEEQLAAGPAQTTPEAATPEAPALPAPPTLPALEAPTTPTPEAPVAETPVAAPEVKEGAITPDAIAGMTLSPNVRKYLMTEVVGKTKDEVQAMVDATPTLIEGRGQRAKAIRSLLIPEVPPFKEATNAQPTPTPSIATEQGPEPGISEPSVAVPSAPAPGTVAEGPGAPLNLHHLSDSDWFLLSNLLAREQYLQSVSSNH